MSSFKKDAFPSVSKLCQCRFCVQQQQQQQHIESASNHHFWSCQDDSFNSHQIKVDDADQQAIQWPNRNVPVQETTNISFDSMSSSSSSSSMQKESLAEVEFIEQLKVLTYTFINRPDRRYSYSTNMHWKVNHCKQLKFNVIISMKELCPFLKHDQ